MLQSFETEHCSLSNAVMSTAVIYPCERTRVQIMAAGLAVMFLLGKESPTTKRHIMFRFTRGAPKIVGERVVMEALLT